MTFEQQLFKESDHIKIWDEIFEEGVSRSYGYEILIRIVSTALKDHYIESALPEQVSTKEINPYGKTATVQFIFKNLNDSSYKTLDRILNSHGYIISTNKDKGYIQHYDANINLITVEPKYPFSVNAEELYKSGLELIHVTDPKTSDKIKEIGLVPKLSRSTFEHDQNIYILGINYFTNIELVAQMIASNRNKKLNKDRYDYTNWVYFKIKLPPIFPLYVDNMFVDKTTPPRFFSFFSKEPIPKKYLKMYKLF